MRNSLDFILDGGEKVSKFRSRNMSSILSSLELSVSFPSWPFAHKREKQKQYAFFALVRVNSLLRDLSVRRQLIASDQDHQLPHHRSKNKAWGKEGFVCE